MRIYKKPGVCLRGPFLGVPLRYAALAEPAIAPSEILALVLDIEFSCPSGEASDASVLPQVREAIKLVCKKKNADGR